MKMMHKNALFRQRRSRGHGVPPGEIAYTGEKKVDAIRLSLISYDGADLSEQQPQSLNELLEIQAPGNVRWINIDGLHDTAVIQQLGSHFDLHPLILEDAVNVDQRPKLESVGDTIFVVLKMLSFNQDKAILEAEQVSLIMTGSTLITLQERSGDVFEGVRTRLRAGRGRIRHWGADYLSYALLDAVVDSYFAILEQVGDDIESLEDEVMTSPDNQTMQRLHANKRRLLYLKKAIWPLREAVSRLERLESTLVSSQVQPYFRDLYDHTIQIMDMLETMKDMNSGLYDMYLSNVSNRMNEVMKVLTIIATIFIPITFVAGIYGMNFEWMPELKWKFAYPAVWAVIIALVGGMLRYFKRKDWI